MKEKDSRKARAASKAYKSALPNKLLPTLPRLLLCLTVIGLIKIYTGFEKIRTLADSFLEFVSIGFLVAAVLSYLARSAKKSSPPMKLAP